MNSTELSLEILKSFGFAPTHDQRAAVDIFAKFMFTPSSTSVMVMRGSAGTGKTSLAAAIVQTLVRLGLRVVLLAPTGRAAKVFSLSSGLPAHTIHRKIYRQFSFAGTDTGFRLNDNLHKNTMFIVDEASMVNHSPSLPQGGELFGNNGLLDDLIKYVYQGDNCHLMLIGDKAQLPPVGEDEAPALDGMVLGGYGLDIFECDLEKVLRQSQDSGILFNATNIRQMITHDEITQLPRICFRGFADISIVKGDELIETLDSSYRKVGVDGTMVVTRSNKRANIYNQGIRNMILGREDVLVSGDRIMVVKNNYMTSSKAEEASKDTPSFIANGDIAIVQRVRNHVSLYGLNFAEVWMQFPDYENYELQTKVILDSLSSEAPSLTHEQQEQLFQGVYDDYFDKHTKAEKLKAVREDDYYNALQIKYAYAITCHKAQGGQWEHIYLDQGYMTDEMLTPDYIHWLYTAFTRATDHLYLVNWPDTQVE